MEKSSLTVVGTGIKFLSQLTLEARSYLEKSDKVLFLVSDPALKQWTQNTNHNTESLDDLYFKYPKRADSYQAITRYILTQLAEIQHLCVAMYGHPTVFAQPALDAVIAARQQGHDAKILPGISAEACLFADLLIDPGTCGCQSFEATDFLLRRRVFDPNSHLILWQPDVIGFQEHTTVSNRIGLQLLMKHLLHFYPPTHEVVMYEAAQYPGIEPNTMPILLQNLADASLSPICTLYIKPASVTPIDRDYADQLQIHKNHD